MKTFYAFMWSTTLIVCLIVCFSVAEAKGVIVDQLISVYDGDTFKITQRNWPEVFGKKLNIRVRGVDTPELRGKCRQEKLLAKEAKAFSLRLLANARFITLENLKRGKYFRLLADVYIDNVSLADKLISAGLGRPYEGGRRGGWCQ